MACTDQKCTHGYTYRHTHTRTHTFYQRIEFEQFYEYCLMMKKFNSPDPEAQKSHPKFKNYPKPKVIKSDETETNIGLCVHAPRGANHLYRCVPFLQTAAASIPPEDEDADDEKKMCLG